MTSVQISTLQTMEDPTPQQLDIPCSPREGPMLEQFVEDCSPWEGSQTERCEEGMAEVKLYELIATPISLC